MLGVLIVALLLLSLMVISATRLVEIDRRARDFLVVVDTSRSMREDTALLRGQFPPTFERRAELYGGQSENLVRDLTNLRINTGSNVIRWVMNWTAFNPEVDVIDLGWLRKTTESFKVAIKMGFFILLDFHQDLFSQYIVGGGNGAPKYIVDGMNVSKQGCRPKFLCFAWSINYFLNDGVKEANRAFWTNKLINTTEGKRHVQDEFIWAIKRALS